MAYKLSMRHEQDHINRRNNLTSDINLRHFVRLFSLLGCISLITAFFFDSNEKLIDAVTLKRTFSGEQYIKPSYTSPSFTAQKDNSVFSIDIHIPFRNVGWATIEGQLLDDETKSLLSFEHELWYEKGKDSGGQKWSARENKLNFDFTVSQAGTYTLKLDIDTNQQLDAVNLRFSQKQGSHIPHLFFGILLVAAAIFLHFYNKRRDFTHHSQSSQAEHDLKTLLTLFSITFLGGIFFISTSLFLIGLLMIVATLAYRRYKAKH